MSYWSFVPSFWSLHISFLVLSLSRLLLIPESCDLFTHQTRAVGLIHRNVWRSESLHTAVNINVKCPRRTLVSPHTALQQLQCFYEVILLDQFCVVKSHRTSPSSEPSVLLSTYIKPMIGPSLRPAASARSLASWSRLVSIVVFIMLTCTLTLLLLLPLIPVLLLLEVVSPLLWGRPALVGSLFLLLGVTVIIGGEGVVEVVVVPSVGAGVRLLLAGAQFQRAVPHSVTTVDQQTCRQTATVNFESKSRRQRWRLSTWGELSAFMNSASAHKSDAISKMWYLA